MHSRRTFLLRLFHVLCPSAYTDTGAHRSAEGNMTDVLLIIFSALAVFGAYCILAEIRTALKRMAAKRNKCAKNIRLPFDKHP